MTVTFELINIITWLFSLCVLNIVISPYMAAVGEPTCEAYKVQNISQNTEVYYIKYNLGRHVSALFKPSAGPQETDPK